jgi:hypothetical protein
MKEWLEHYLLHGVEHFYLINDRSTDESLDILKEYIDKGVVELFHTDKPMYYGRQRDSYDELILPRLQAREMKWLMMIDFDEFVWSPMNVDLRVVLGYLSRFKQIQLGQVLFGSNGHIEQPKSVVAGFTKHSSESLTGIPFKYIVQSDVDFVRLDVHIARFAKKEMYGDDTFMIVNPNWIVLNHYNCQSRSFWQTTKMTRGDADNYKVRDMELFNTMNRNDVEDTRLLEQNKELLTTLGYI